MFQVQCLYDLKINRTNMNKNPTSMKPKTDFALLDKMKDEDIDYSDAPAITSEMFAKSIVRRGFKRRTMDFARG